MSTEDEVKKAEELKAQGNILFGQDRFREAAEEYSKAIELTPENHVLYANRAACYAQKAVERYEEALIDAIHCVDLAPTWVKGYARKAHAEYLNQKYADAEATCRAGLELEPHGKQGAMFRAQLQMLRDAHHRTNLEADTLMANKEAAAREKTRGNSAFQEKKWDEAVVLFTNALEFDPTDHVFWSNRSAAYAEKDEFHDALRDAQFCVELKAEWPKGYNRLAVAQYHLGRYQECLKAAQEGLKRDGDNGMLSALLADVERDCAEPPAVQTALHHMRKEQRKQKKMMTLLKNIPGLDLRNVQMNNVGGRELYTMGAMAGTAGAPVNTGICDMTHAQMRVMARAMASTEVLSFLALLVQKYKY